MPDLVTVPEVIAAARANLLNELWDFASGGAGADTTIRRNRSVIERSPSCHGCWAVAAGGTDGLEQTLGMLRDEMIATTAMLGVNSLDELDPQHLSAGGTQVAPGSTAYGLGMSKNDGNAAVNFRAAA